MKKLLVVLAIVALGGMGWYAYSVFHARYEPETPPADAVLERDGEEKSDTWNLPSVWNTGESAESEPETEEEDALPTEETLPEDVERDADIPEVDIDTDLRDGDEESVEANITNTHCETGCEAFANDFAYLEYCRQVCGLEEPQNVTPADCENLEGLRRDYCLKDAAIIANDPAICDGIADANIRTTCESRVTESFLEGL